MPIDFAPLWNFADPAASEQRFRALLDDPQRPLETPDRAEVLTQIARAQGLQQRFDEGHRTLDEAARLNGDARGRALVRILLERGRLVNSAGTPAESATWFEQAWPAALESNEDALAIDAAHMLGIVLPGDAGMTWNQQALDLASRSPDPAARRWAASLHNNIAWSLHDQGRFDDALHHFHAAAQHREAMGQPGPLRIARWCIARCLRSLNRLDEALTHQRALRAELDRSGEDDGYVEEELGECLLALGRADEARPHFARAAKALAPTLATTDPARLARLHQLS